VFISIAAKEWLFQITAKLGRKTRSQLLQANAWHHRTDALSSVIVLVGVVGALFGFPWLELLAAVGVASMIALIGGSLAKQSIAELVDTALSESYVDEIREHVQHVEGVSGVHSIRTRRMGADALVDIHLQVNPLISVSEGHHIGEWVTKRLLTEFTEVNDVIVHIDAEDDEYLEERTTDDIAPLRKEVRKCLSEVWKDILPAGQIQKMNLHYLNNCINIELFLNRERESESTGVLKLQKGENTQTSLALEEELKQAGHYLPWLQKISIWYG
jgi:hypothetical protein